MGSVNLWFSGTDDVSEVFYFIAEEDTPFHFERDTRFAEGFEYFVNVTYVFLDSVRINDIVIYIKETGLRLEFG